MAIENLNKRIAELEAENNRLRAETTRTIIPESAWIELEKKCNDLSKSYQELLKSKIPPMSEYQKLDDENRALQTELRIFKEAYYDLARDYANCANKSNDTTNPNREK
jgi:predicted RNase H-like nuclease (RuvC/YqgF family)